jgi:uncharacterized protein YndB with AHSA1/START domain
MLRFSVSTHVPRPIEEVFDHLVEPGLLSSYFTSEASGPLEAGKRVHWTWASGESADVDVETVERNRRVVLRWKAFRVETITRVAIAFERTSDERTLVTIEESGWDASETVSAFEHCAGWQHMLLCLKARMAFGIDLRG